MNRKDEICIPTNVMHEYIDARTRDLVFILVTIVKLGESILKLCKKNRLHAIIVSVQRNKMLKCHKNN